MKTKGGFLIFVFFSPKKKIKKEKISLIQNGKFRSGLTFFKVKKTKIHISFIIK